MKKDVIITSFNLKDPIDFIEELAENHEWIYQRTNMHELTLNCPGTWCNYRVAFMWVEEMQTLGITASFNMRVSKKSLSPLYELLSRINEELWIGHFDLSDEGMPTYRYTLLLRNVPNGDYLALIEEVIQIAVEECERFYPAFQFALWAGKRPLDALTSAMLETVGEA